MLSRTVSSGSKSLIFSTISGARYIASNSRGKSDNNIYITSLIDSIAQDFTGLAAKMQALQSAIGMNHIPLIYGVNHAKKSPTTYTLFYQYHYDKTKREHPDFEPQAITKIVSEKWRSLTKDEQKNWTIEDEY